MYRIKHIRPPCALKSENGLPNWSSARFQFSVMVESALLSFRALVTPKLDTNDELRPRVCARPDLDAREDALESDRWRFDRDKLVRRKSRAEISEARESARPMSKRVESAHEALESNRGRCWCALRCEGDEAALDPSE